MKWQCMHVCIATYTRLGKTAENSGRIFADVGSMKVNIFYIHLIQKRLSSELLHCALCIAHCCMPRPQIIAVHIAST